MPQQQQKGERSLIDRNGVEKARHGLQAFVRGTGISDDARRNPITGQRRARHKYSGSKDP